MSLENSTDLFIVSIRSSLTHLHGFQLLVLLPHFIEMSFFVSTNRINILNLKKSVDRLVIIGKAFLKLLNVHMLATKTSLPRNLVLGTFRELLTVFSTKLNLLYLRYSTAQRCCLLLLIKQNCLVKKFLRTLILMTQVSLYLFSFVELI